MDSPRPISARSSSRAGFTLVEILIASSLTLILTFGVLSAYLFLGRNFTRLASTQQQDVKARRALFQFAQDVGKAISFTSTSSSNLTFTTPTTLANCSTTANSATVTCTTTGALSAGMTVWGPPLIALTNCATTALSANVTCASTAGLYAGVEISGPGIPIIYVPPSPVAPGIIQTIFPVTVKSITNGTTFVLSTNATLTTTGGTLYAKVKNIPDNTTVSSITNGTTFVLSASAKATTSGVELSTTTPITYAYDSIAGTLTRTAASGTTTLLTDIDSAYAPAAIPLLSPTNGFAYYNQFGATVTSTTTVRAVEFVFTTKVGSAANGTQTSYKIVSPRVVVRNNNSQTQ